MGAFSFNHYAFGCVGDWLVRHIGGLTPIEPGYREFKVEPHFGDRFKYAETQYESVYGEIQVKWEIKDDTKMFLQVMVPANTFAVISLTNVNPDCIQDLKKYVSKKGYVDLHYYEEEKDFNSVQVRDK